MDRWEGGRSSGWVGGRRDSEEREGGVKEIGKQSELDNLVKSFSRILITGFSTL